jgi:hypothetical protein
LVLDVALIYVADVRLEPLMPPVSDLPLAIRDAFNFAVPPLIVDMFFQEERKNLRRIAWWNCCRIALYAVCTAGLAFTVIAPFCASDWRFFRLWSYPMFTAVLGVARSLSENSGRLGEQRERNR